jgi:hypothetical protein
MSDYVKVKLRLQYEGASPEEMGWLEFRAFMDCLVQALEAMPHGPRAADIIPILVGDGSVKPTIRMPREAMRAVRRLQGGPRRGWTSTQRAGVEPLYQFLRSKSATLTGGATRGAGRPFVIPDLTPKWQIHELAALTGTVHRVGGNDDKVVLRMDDSQELVHFDAGAAIVEDIGQYMHKRVRADVDIARDALTRAVLAAKIIAFTVLNRPRRRFLDELKEALGNDRLEIDMAEFMKVQRG